MVGGHVVVAAGGEIEGINCYYLVIHFLFVLLNIAVCIFLFSHY